MAIAEVTAPLRSRWDQQDAEFIASDLDWVQRCARAIASADGFLGFDEAVGMALELSTASALRARSPERVAEDLLRRSTGVQC